MLFNRLSNRLADVAEQVEVGGSPGDFRKRRNSLDAVWLGFERLPREISRADRDGTTLIWKFGPGDAAGAPVELFAESVVER